MKGALKLKRFVIVSIFVVAMLMVGAQLNASTIDLISQTYSMGGTAYFPPSGISFSLTSSVPILTPPYPEFSGYANGGASGSSAFVDIATHTDVGGGPFSASASLAFRVTGASDLDLTYKFPPYASWIFNSASLVLVDSTTGVTLLNVPPSGPPNLNPLVVSVDIPVVSSDIYTLTATCRANPDSTGVTATLNAVPEPSSMLFLGAGLVGLVGFRKQFKK